MGVWKRRNQVLLLLVVLEMVVVTMEWVMVVAYHSVVYPCIGLQLAP